MTKRTDSLPRKSRIRHMMRSYAGADHTVVGLALSNGQTASACVGQGLAETRVDDLIFEIGSITKVFTAILLCVLIEEGEVDPQAPLRDWSSALSILPDWITAESLASHTSGLPRIHIPIWTALIRPLPADPYAAFTRSDLLEWLRAWPGKAKQPKRRHAYSNLGVGLLGEAMAMRARSPFLDLLTEKVIGPLGLKDTTACLDGSQQSRFMQPRDTKGRAVVPWTFSAMAAAGCLRSSARDLACFSNRVIQALNDPQTVLDRAICRSVQPIFGLGPRARMEPVAQCAGWLSVRLGEASPRLLYHDGGTAGSTCAIYVCPEKAAALVLLSNNGVAANLWASAKLSWSNQLRQAHDHFSEL